MTTKGEETKSKLPIGTSEDSARQADETPRRKSRGKLQALHASGQASRADG
jgi:hypothetical protein